MTRKKPAPSQPPAHLDSTAIAKWREIIGSVDLSHPGTGDALTCYCGAWSRLVEAENKLKELGPVVRTAAGFAAVSPYAAIQKDAQRQLRQWADVLGLHKQQHRKATKPAAPEGDPDAELRTLSMLAQLNRANA